MTNVFYFAALSLKTTLTRMSSIIIINQDLFIQALLFQVINASIDTIEPWKNKQMVWTKR